MPLDQAGEGRFGINPIARGELLQELPIRQPADRPRVEQRGPTGNPLLSDCWPWAEPPADGLYYIQVDYPGGPTIPTFSEFGESQLELRLALVSFAADDPHKPSGQD